jgi:phenylpyruvate tautomerase
MEKTTGVVAPPNPPFQRFIASGAATVSTHIFPLRLCAFVVKNIQAMPLLKLETTVSLTDEKRASLLPALSRIVAETIGKPEQYVMVTANQVSILMSGKSGDAAFVEVRSIGGLGGDVNRQLSQRICHLLNQSLGVPSNRVYLNFIDVEGENWGWDGNTFG